MLGLRVRDITRREIRAALAERRTLVKTVGPRGTLHLLPATELPEWMAAMRLREPAEERRLAKAGIEMDEFHRVVDAIGDIVGPHPITRPEFEAALAERAPGWALTTNQGWVGSYRNWPLALGWAAALGSVCYGPGEGGRITFVRLTDWSEWREVDPIEGGVFALRRFLRAYGPSTQAEFSRWFALDPALTRQLFTRLADEAAEIDVEGTRRWLLRVDRRQHAEPAPDAVHLLPQFDVFTVGSHPRDQLVEPGSALARASPGTAAPLAVLLMGGRVAGVWERQPKGKRLLIRVDSHRPLNRMQRASVEAQAERIAAILERDCEFELGHVEIRPHL
jgi:hypothetical protein